MYPSISKDDPEFYSKIIGELESQGLVVIDDVYDPETCDKFVEDIFTNFEQLGTGINKLDLNTWKSNILPIQTKAGLFKNLVANFPVLWSIRSNNFIIDTYQKIYSHFWKCDVDQLIVSTDVLNLKLAQQKPWDNSLKDDWAHLDQVVYGGTYYKGEYIPNETYNYIYNCFQGSVALTTSTGAFRASPGSHKCHEQIMATLNINTISSFYKFQRKQIKTVKKIITDNGGEYQIPIYCKKGSLIIWASTLVHSAKFPDKPSCLEIQPTTDFTIPDDLRCVVYVSYQPLMAFSNHQLREKVNAFHNNLATNHWGRDILPPRIGQSSLYDNTDSTIMQFIDDPKLVYEKVGKVKLNKKQQRLLGVTDL